MQNYMRRPAIRDFVPYESPYGRHGTSGGRGGRRGRPGGDETATGSRTKAPREACEALLRTAPTECTRGMIAGIMVIRSQMEAMRSATMGTAVWTQPTAVAARKGTAKAAD